MLRLSRVLFLMFAIVLFAVAAAPTCAVQVWTVSLDGRRLDQQVDTAGNLHVLAALADGSGARVVTFDPSGRLSHTSPSLRDYVANDPAALAIGPTGFMYVTVGSFYSDAPHDVITVKYDSTGAPLWRAPFALQPGWCAPWVRNTIDDRNGAVYVLAEMYSTVDSGYAFTVIKFSSDGQEEWGAPPIAGEVRRYRDGREFAGEVAVTSDGGVLVAGSGRMLKYSAQGELEWNRSDAGAPIAVDASGQIFATDTNTVRKLSSSGELLWSATSNDYVTFLETDAAGNAYAVIGDKRTEHISKFGPSGERLWSVPYVTPPQEWSQYGWPLGLALDAAGNAYVLNSHLSALSEGVGHAGADAIVSKYDVDGERQWVAIHSWPGDIFSWPTAVQVDREGDLYLFLDHSPGVDRYSADIIKYVQVEYGGGP